MCVLSVVAKVITEALLTGSQCYPQDFWLGDSSLHDITRELFRLIHSILYLVRVLGQEEERFTCYGQY
jgi:hypothetical protein